MSKNIINQSVFGNYTQPENQVTCALLKIFEKDENEILLKALLQDLDEDRRKSLPEKDIKIDTQARNPRGQSVLDGKLSCRFAFDIYIESKLGTTINKAQLDEHSKLLETNENVILIYITTHAKRPSVLPNEILWANWTKIYKVINEVHEEGVNPVLDYLIDQFYLLLRALGLYDDSKNRVLIVGGSWGENIALNYNFYACQADRSFKKKSRYLAFYHNQRIQYLFEIEDIDMTKLPDNIELDHVDIRSLPENLVPKEYFQKEDPNYSGFRTFFKLKFVKEFTPAIQNNKQSKTGKTVAFVQNQTYTTLEKINKAKYTLELR
jgi:hypothetical protein